MTDALAKALHYHLTATASAVASIVGTRVYPRGRVPRTATAPYLVYSQVGANHLRDASGGVGEARTRVQVDGWCDSANDQRTLRDALREALDNYVGNMGEAGATVAVRHCGLVVDEDIPAAAAPGEEAGLVGLVQDYVFCHTESETP